MFASLPPRGWWWAGIAGLALLGWSLRHRSWRTRVGYGYLAGVGLSAPGLMWLARFTLPGFILLVVLEAAFVALAAGLMTDGRAVLLSPAVVIAEWLRGTWPLGGLPLAAPALGQVDGPFAVTAALGGPLAVVAVAGLAAAAVVELGAGSRTVAVGLVAVAVAVTLAGSLAATATSPAGPPLRVAVVQGGGPRGIPAVRSDPHDTFRRHLQVSATIPHGTELVLWPEDVVDVDGPVARTLEGDQLGALAATTGATLIAGVTEEEPGRWFRNAAIAWTPAGAIVDRYDKVHRVPFGEYVPLRTLLEPIVDLSLVPRDAIPGDGPGLLTTPAGPIGVAISFEVFFPDPTRTAVRAGGRIVVVPTNAASFTTDDVPAQELAAARLRAIETGRTVVQAAPTGYSAVIAPDGAVRSRSDLGTPHVLVDDVAPRQGRTPYVVLGDAPLLVLAIAGLALATVPSRAGLKIR